MAARKTKTDTATAAELADEAPAAAEIVKRVPRPHGLEAVYERQPDGEITRTVRKADQAPADRSPADEDDGSELEGFDVEQGPAEEA